MKKSLIVICGLNHELALKVGKLLSSSLDMFFLSLKQLVEYEVFKDDDLLKKVGKQYLEKLETKAVKRAASFENTVVVASYDIFAYKQNYQFFKQNSYILYLRQTKSVLQKQKGANTLDKVNFVARDNTLKQIANFTLTVQNNSASQASQKIINKLKEVFL